MSTKRNGNQKGAAHDIVQQTIDKFDRALNEDRPIAQVPDDDAADPKGNGETHDSGGPVINITPEEGEEDE